MSAPGTVTVVLADDHPVVRSGLAALLDTAEGIDVVAAAANGQEAVDAVSRLRPAVVLMDLRMPVLDGAGATAQIRDRFPDTKVLVLTTYDDDSDIMRAVESGAVGYLLKDTPGDRIIEAVRAAARAVRRSWRRRSRPAWSRACGRRSCRGSRPGRWRSSAASPRD